MTSIPNLLLNLLLLDLWCLHNILPGAQITAKYGAQITAGTHSTHTKTTTRVSNLPSGPRGPHMRSYMSMHEHVTDPAVQTRLQ